MAGGWGHPVPQFVMFPYSLPVNVLNFGMNTGPNFSP